MKKDIKAMYLLFFFLVICSICIIIIKGKNNTDQKNENNMTTFLEQDMEDYLRKELPELSKYEQYITEKSNQQAFLIIENKGVFDELKEESKYYLIYVGEQWDNHKANWDYFLVNEALNNILFIDMMDSTVLTLEEWRASQYYRNLD